MSSSSEKSDTGVVDQIERADSVSSSSDTPSPDSPSPNSPSPNSPSPDSPSEPVDGISESGDVASDTSSVVSTKEVTFNPSSMKDGNYVYYFTSTFGVDKVMTYMYHTIDNLTPINRTNNIQFHITRTPYKYDSKDVGYASIGFGTYKYNFKGHIFDIEYIQEIKAVGTDDEPKKFKSLTVLSSSCEMFDKFFRCVSNHNDDSEIDECKLNVYIMNKYGEWLKYNKIPSRTLKTVYFDDKLKQKCRDDIADFLKKEKEYQEFGIPYKKNYLLTGIPGSGKTSLIKALCKEIGHHLCIFSINHDVDNHTALCAFRDIPPKSILLIEDIDCLFEKRTGTDENKHFTFSNLINLLDGVLSRQGLITFMTTNHPENMDHALLRQGRVDLIIHMNYPRKIDIKNLFRDIMVKSCLSVDEIDKEFELFHGYIQKKTITMAAIVSFLFRYKKEWQENINELLDADRFIKEVTKNIEDSKLYS